MFRPHLDGIGEDPFARHWRGGNSRRPLKKRLACQCSIGQCGRGAALRCKCLPAQYSAKELWCTAHRWARKRPTREGYPDMDRRCRRLQCPRCRPRLPCPRCRPRLLPSCSMSSMSWSLPYRLRYLQIPASSKALRKLQKAPPKPQISKTPMPKPASSLLLQWPLE